MQRNKSSIGASVPESLYLQTGLMIQHEILDLEAIYDMLGPEDSVILDDADKEKSYDFLKGKRHYHYFEIISFFYI